jgi:hypothetical protein
VWLGSTNDFCRLKEARLDDRYRDTELRYESFALPEQGQTLITYHPHAGSGEERGLADLRYLALAKPLGTNQPAQAPPRSDRPQSTS